MARSLLSLVPRLKARLVTGAANEERAVESSVLLRDFAVPGHPAFTTVVVTDASELRAALERDAGLGSRLHDVGLVVCGETRDEAPLAGVTTLLTPLPEGEAHAAITAELALTQAAIDRAVSAGTTVLTQVARRGGSGAVVAELARQVDGWVVLLDTHGQTIATAGAGSLHIADARAVAFARPVRVRHPDLQVHRVGLGEDLTAYLVLSSRLARASTSRDLAAQAAALLDLTLRRHDHSSTERLGREIMLRDILHGGAEAAALVRRWGLRESRLAAFRLTALSRTVDLERLLRGWLDDLDSPHLFTVGPDGATGLIRPAVAPELAARAEDFGTPGSPSLHLGLGTARPLEALAPSAREAAEALATAISTGRVAVRFSRLPTVRLVLDRLDASDTQQLTDTLSPLSEDPEAAALIAAIREYLTHSGNMSHAARVLGIHRQTLMHRLARAEELLGVGLEDPDVRAGLWLALRAAGR